VAGRAKKALASTYYIHFKWSNSMKKIIFLLAAVLLCTAPLYAQAPPASQAIPELQEWWRAPADEKGLGQYGVSYIPNFYHGKDAMGVSIKNGQMETWLNRFPGDRENVFTWKGGGPVLQADFNGDGITDYLGGAIVYRGVKNGEPPDSIPVATLAISPSMIADVNHDGYDDIVDWYDGGGRSYGGSIGRVAYGAADFNDMKVVSFNCATSMDSTMEMERMYMGTDGDMRILMFAYDLVGDPRRDFNGYFLFRAKWKTGDTLPTYEKLAEVIRYRDTDIPFDRNGAVYQSKHHSNIYFIAKETLGTQWNLSIYNLSEDKFRATNKLFFTTSSRATPQLLQGSINEDRYEDWMLTRSGQKYEFYSGGEILDTAKFAESKQICESDGVAIGGRYFQTIGDVNQDGIGDIVFGSMSNAVPNCFRILLGIKKTSGVSEPPSSKETTFSLTDPSPHPLVRGKATRLIVTTSQNGIYTLELYSADSKKVTELVQQYFELGKHEVTIDISHYPLASGSYILRFRSEKDIIIGQRTIIIE
jgi:hypothetical protein